MGTPVRRAARRVPSFLLRACEVTVPVVSTTREVEPISPFERTRVKAAVSEAYQDTLVRKVDGIQETPVVVREKGFNEELGPTDPEDHLLAVLKKNAFRGNTNLDVMRALQSLAGKDTLTVEGFQQFCHLLLYLRLPAHAAHIVLDLVRRNVVKHAVHPASCSDQTALFSAGTLLTYYDNEAGTTELLKFLVEERILPMPPDTFVEGGKHLMFVMRALLMRPAREELGLKIMDKAISEALEGWYPHQKMHIFRYGARLKGDRSGPRSDYLTLLQKHVDDIEATGDVHMLLVPIYFPWQGRDLTTMVAKLSRSIVQNGEAVFRSKNYPPDVAVTMLELRTAKDDLSWLVIFDVFMKKPNFKITALAKILPAMAHCGWHPTKLISHIQEEVVRQPWPQRVGPNDTARMLVAMRKLSMMTGEVLGDVLEKSQFFSRAVAWGKVFPVAAVGSCLVVAEAEVREKYKGRVLGSFVQKNLLADAKPSQLVGMIIAAFTLGNNCRTFRTLLRKLVTHPARAPRQMLDLLLRPSVTFPQSVYAQIIHCLPVPSLSPKEALTLIHSAAALSIAHPRPVATELYKKAAQIPREKMMIEATHVKLILKSMSASRVTHAPLISKLTAVVKGGTAGFS
eukprot:TRINITY_DN743_c0_g2_i2.p1 TRINITY_DN743_c0_g2~~TRINITY_DN743_c0_g2_i2.p1  ORF type:complete len:625 (+),score=122.81 TRINITY_DN743_c0_g2_i2:42-1916(+)